MSCITTFMTIIFNFTLISDWLMTSDVWCQINTFSHDTWSSLFHVVFSQLAAEQKYSSHFRRKKLFLTLFFLKFFLLQFFKNFLMITMSVNSVSLISAWAFCFICIHLISFIIQIRICADLNFIFHFFVFYLASLFWSFSVSCFFLLSCFMMSDFIKMLSWIMRMTSVLISLIFSQTILLTVSSTASQSQIMTIQMMILTMIQMMTLFTMMKSSIHQNTISQKLINWMSLSFNSNNTVSRFRKTWMRQEIIEISEKCNFSVVLHKN